MKDDGYERESIRTIQMRNCVYQGFLNDKGKKTGFGIILDDDMNLYCSQWQNNQLNGHTLCILNNNKYIFGLFKNDKIHGSALYRDDQYSIASKYSNGVPFGNAVAFPISLTNAIVFQGSTLMAKSKRKEVLTANFIKIKQIKVFQDLINEVTEVYDINIKKSGSSLMEMLNKFFKKYERHLVFNKRDGIYNFGFKTGLRFEFMMDGNVYQKIRMTARGIFNRFLQFGIKIHEGRCIEEGNFKTKETITYNSFSDRPFQKCKMHYQKMHKKSLCFVNQYFYLKENLIDIYAEFISKKLQITFQRKVAEDYTKNTYKQIRSQCIQIDQNEEQRQQKKIGGLNKDENKNINIEQQYKRCNRLVKNKSLNEINKNRKISPSFHNKKCSYKRISPHLTKNKSMIQIKKISVRDIQHNEQIPKKTLRVVDQQSKDIYLEDNPNRFKGRRELKKSPSRLNEQRIREQLRVYQQTKYCNQINNKRVPLKQYDFSDKKTKQDRKLVQPSEMLIGERSYLGQLQISQRFEQIENRRKKLICQFKNLNFDQSKREQNDQSGGTSKLNASTIRCREDQFVDYSNSQKSRFFREKEQSLSEISSFNNRYKGLIKQSQIHVGKKYKIEQRQNQFKFTS